MEDQNIIRLLEARSEEGLSALSEKYGAYCREILRRILESPEDIEECLNDTWMRVWQSIPPTSPVSLKLYAGKCARNLALDRLRRERAVKRGGELTRVEEELEILASRGPGPEEEVLLQDRIRSLNAFLGELPTEKRVIFVRRYWYLDSIADLADQFGCSERRINGILHRVREKLKKKWKEEGLD